MVTAAEPEVRGGALVQGISIVRRRRGSAFTLGPVDLHLSAGVTVLLGVNGAGKTTLLRLLAGDLRPDHGTVRVGGAVWGGSGRDGSDYQRFVGYLPQDPDAPAGFRVGDAVAYAAWLKKVDEVDEQVASTLEAVDLVSRAGDRIRTLSGGMRRRVAIAASVVHRPGLLLLDEPLVGLDPEQRRNLRTLVRELARGRSVLVSTHQIDDLACGAARVLVLEQGRIIADGTPAELAGGPEPTAQALEEAFVDILQRARRQ